MQAWPSRRAPAPPNWHRRRRHARHAVAAAAGKRQVIIDTDPGQDDAIALLMAMAATDRLDIKAPTVSVGNLPLTVTEKNARIVRDWAGAA